MGTLQQFAEKMAQKLLQKQGWTFSTTVQSEEWYQRNGYYRLSENLNGVDSAFTLGAFFGGVKIIAEDEARLPLKLLRRLGPSDTEEATTNSVYDRFVYEPNPEQTPQQFRECMTVHAILGDAYARIERLGKDIVALWPMSPADVSVQYRNGQKYFQWTNPRTRKQIDLDLADVLHLKGFTMNGDEGVPLLKFARRALRLAISQEEYADEFFKNDHTPGVVLETPEAIGPDSVKAVKKAWKENVKSHDVAILQGGMKATRWSQTNTDAQLTEQRLQELSNVARFLRMPPPKLGDMSRMTFSNAEQINIWYFNETLAPYLTRWEQCIWQACLRPAKDLFMRHTVRALQLADFKTQSEGFARGLEKGVYSINEVRDWLNLNRIEGGDEHHIQLNMQAVQDAANQTAEAQAEPAQQQPQGGKLFELIHRQGAAS